MSAFGYTAVAIFIVVGLALIAYGFYQLMGDNPKDKDSSKRG